MAGTAEALGIEHVFVLMLENRSFDHMLGFSGIAGADAATGQPTRIDGLTGNETNIFNGQPFMVAQGADYVMPVDPNHEFPDILHQLCGPAAQYPSGGPYPPIDNSGYVASYSASGGSAAPGEVMKCYTPDQLPVLSALAREFVVCDNWQSSLPGPTWPNRMFAHAASSSGLDHSPTIAEIAEWETFAGLAFPNGTIFDRLAGAGVTRCLYAGDVFPIVGALKGIGPADIRQYSLFQADLAQPAYPYRYAFIEPAYDVLNDYRSGNSQHPLGDVTAGELLIKQTYEAIRNSPAWNSSVFIVTWDEHGGFFDHAIPPPATVPGDTAPGAQYNQYGFTFAQYGARVPAVVISPLIPKNLIDHRVYDHSCIPRLLESLFGMAPLTARDAAALSLDALITLKVPRSDAPAWLPQPADSGAAVGTATYLAPGHVTRPNETANGGSLPVVVQSAMRQDLALSPPSERASIISQVQAIKTRADAARYLEQVRQKINASRAASAGN